MNEIETIILDESMSVKDKIAALTRKNVNVPSWNKLEREYDKKKHPIMYDPAYADKVDKKGGVERKTKVTLGWQKLATKRMAALLCGIPVKRIYKPADDKQKQAAAILEDIYAHNRINAVNLERARYLYAACEFVTIWYSQEQQTVYAGNPSNLKLRCRNYSPIKGDTLYPLFDDYGDLVALSIAYVRNENGTVRRYMDTYTESLHVCWNMTDGTEILREDVSVGKITGVYAYRDEPVWEDESDNVCEAEYTLSRNGNYIRKNTRPKLGIYTDAKVKTDKAPKDDRDSSEVIRLNKGDKIEYVTWPGASDAIRFHVEQLKYNFNSQLQLPDVSMDNMKTTPMSGESRKMIFMDAQMKVTNESGIWLEVYDRELNVVRAFAAIMFPELADAINTVSVEHQITPFQIRDDKERVETLSTAQGTIASRLTCIRRLGWADDPEAELQQIQQEASEDLFAPVE